MTTPAGIYAAGIPALHGMTATERRALVAAIGEDVAPTLREDTIDGRVVAPMTGSIVRARKP
jgi:hypothetical protein